MTEPNEARLRCRQCAYPLARLSRDRQFTTVTAGVYLTVVLVAQRVDLRCPHCGMVRSVNDVTFSAMAVPRLDREAC